MKKQNKLLEQLKKAGYFLIHRKGGRYTLIGGILAVCLIVTMSQMHFETTKQAESKSSYVIATEDGSEKTGSKDSRESGNSRDGSGGSKGEKSKESKESREKSGDSGSDSESSKKDGERSDSDKDKKSSDKKEKDTVSSGSLSGSTSGHSGSSSQGSAGGSSGGTSGGTGSSSGTTPAPAPAPSSGGSQSGNGSQSSGSGSTATAPATVTVHLSIQINNISGNNVNRLSNEDDRERAATVSNGTVCSVTLSMRSDQTVYDALVTATEARGIPMGSRNTSYGTYVYMIDDFAEKEAGPSSGWMYSVNGMTPNIGATGYHLTDGAQIVWFYVT